MKLSVSNFAWPQHEALWCYEQLAQRGIKGVEIAPTKVFGENWVIDPDTVLSLRETLCSFDLHISSFQGLTYAKEDVALFGEGSHNFLSHMETIAQLLVECGADYAVLGAVKLRQHLPADYHEMSALFEAVAKRFSTVSKALALESIPPVYGARLLRNLTECTHLINDVDSDGLVLNFDTANQFLCGDLLSGNYRHALAKAKHIHISEPDLCYFHQPSKYNVELASQVKRIYQGKWGVLEMGEKYFTRSGFQRSLDTFLKLYGPLSYSATL
ncbi:sugar phosphate isomerase/epimerase family protein [Vibrio natriegens]|uniref:sugar phosphate isomerase/epimerase family protein n=1 Tax=Vibrio natriegens TaxID=691 RepID=UPI003B5C84E7